MEKWNARSSAKQNPAARLPLRMHYNMIKNQMYYKPYIQTKHQTLHMNFMRYSRLRYAYREYTHTHIVNEELLLS